MKFKMTHDFNWPLEKLIPVLAGDEEVLNMEDMPNVSSRKEIERRWEGKKLFKKFAWNVHGQIPQVAQKIIRPEMLNFIEHSVWDNEKYMFDTKIEPHFLKKQIICSTTSRWAKLTEGKSRRQFEGTLEIKIPLIGQLVEGAIIDHLKKNVEKGAVDLKNVFVKKVGPPTE